MEIVIRDNLFFNLHNFLICLSEQVYKPMGLTKLYVPREDLSNIMILLRNEKRNVSEEKWRYISDESSESKNALIQRFERIVRYWIKQIREVLASTLINKSKGSVFSELQHWTMIC